MTAESIPTAAESVDTVISSTVAALIAGRRVNKPDLALAVGISQAALYKKLSGFSTWKASDVALISSYFEIPITDLYEGFGGRFVQPSTGRPEIAKNPRQLPAGGSGNAIVAGIGFEPMTSGL